MDVDKRPAGAFLGSAITKTFDVELHYHDVEGDSWRNDIIKVQLYVDLEWLANDLGNRAFTSERNRATMGSGHIVAKVVT